jgi:hypothetical protein
MLTAVELDAFAETGTTRGRLLNFCGPQLPRNPEPGIKLQSPLLLGWLRRLDTKPTGPSSRYRIANRRT